MPSHLKISKPVLPAGLTEDAIRQDAIYCPTCLNLYAGSAFVVSSRPGLWVSHNRCHANAAEDEAAGATTPPPQWASTRHRNDYACFAVHIAMSDIHAAAVGGCETCKLLKVVVNEQTPHDSDITAINARFCKGAALRLFMMSPEEQLWEAKLIEDDCAPWGILDDGNVPGRLACIFELFTLPGMCSYSHRFRKVFCLPLLQMRMNGRYSGD